MAMSACFPPPEEGLRLHLRLLDHAPDAAADVCRAYFEPLLLWMERCAPKLDPDLYLTAASQALINYLKNPTSYDPRRACLTTFLQLAARRDLSNLRRSEHRRHRRLAPWSVVEQGERAGKLYGRDEEPVMYLEHQEEAEQMHSIVESVKASCTAAERRVLELMLAGERDTAVYAEALAVAHLPPAEQEREVKRVKDRLKKRLEREGRTHA
jgi:hypothetical protein